ncbi:MAG TPA: sigma 54-interacting transcriptional regulator [Deltaproteobacteria bacterium]|nr:sigma 54-interacting transcriptional regulator [Deltaproteobacteria bacterium]
MASKSLRRKLFLIISLLVIGSGVLISIMVTHRYSISLYQGALAQAENIAHSMALDAADKILINDLVALQKLIDDQRRSNSAISYIFIVRGDRILTHTFTDGVPAKLINANSPVDNEHGHLEKIISHRKERFLDVAWPIFSQKAGVLRLGYSEEPYHNRVTQLWLQMSGFTLLVLLFSLYACHLFIKRTIQPLSNLSNAVEKIDEDNLELSIDIKGYDEVGTLAASFHKMLNRIKEYTRRLQEYTERLETKNLELDRAHKQTRTSFTIAQEIGALLNLNHVAAYLIKKLQEIVTCTNMTLLICSSNHDSLMVFSDGGGSRSFDDRICAEEMRGLFSGEQRVAFLSKDQIHSKILPESFHASNRMALFPMFHEHQLLGGMLISCPDDCQCATKELDIINMIMEQTSGAVHRSLSQEEELRQLRSRIEQSAEFGGLIGKDAKMQVIYNLIKDVATTDATVLIQGESGTGKELVARAIHNKSLRNDRPFVVINCSAYPATLLESELFGHEKGAFTGATRQKKGRFELAGGGTIFLDEVGEIVPNAQIKLLRVLQNRKFERVGGEESLVVDARIIAATNRNLLEDVKKGQFREDLFYRLNVIPICLPSLRERRNDIPLLARHFLRRSAAEQDKDIRDFSTGAMRKLLDYAWPGNVRELENSIEHATVLVKGNRIEVADLPSALLEANGFVLMGESESGKTLKENEKQVLIEMLESCNWNKREAANRLGIGRSTLYVKLKKYQISKPTLH